jgi:hypothetical protein
LRHVLTWGGRSEAGLEDALHVEVNLQEKILMKNYIGAALATVLMTGAAFAAAPAMPPATATPPAAGAGAGAGAQATFMLQAADATKLKDWIMGQKVASVAAPAGFTVSVGATLPATIALHPIDAAAGVTAAGSNQYAVVGDKLVLVSPTDRKIVYIFA